MYLNNETKTIKIPVTQSDLGGFAIKYHFVNYNSFQNGTELISVPHPQKSLQIETLTFRDKLQPGVEETWRFKIKGPKGEKVSAELLASMYDMSLDQFKTHQWDFNPIHLDDEFAKNSIFKKKDFLLTFYPSFLLTIYSPTCKIAGIVSCFLEYLFIIPFTNFTLPPDL